jgi:hypothetical protein
MSLPWHRYLERWVRASTLPGSRIDAFPFLSAYGLLGRLAQLNRWLCSHEMATPEGSVVAISTDWFQLESPARVSRALEFEAGFATRTISRCWLLDRWSPLPLAEHWAARRAPQRICRECATFGYHTAIFQLPWIARCPWHDEALTHTCPHCNEPLPRGGAGGIPFSCPCGARLLVRGRATSRVAEFPREQCEAFLQRYRQWCRQERRQCRILMQPGIVDSEPLLRGLFNPPTDLAHAFTPRDIDVKVRRLTPVSRDRYAGERIPSWLVVADLGHGAAVSLPVRRYDALWRRTSHLLLRLGMVTAKPHLRNNKQRVCDRVAFFNFAQGHFPDKRSDVDERGPPPSLPLFWAHPAWLVTFQRLIAQLEREAEHWGESSPRSTMEMRRRRAEVHPAAAALVDALERLLMRAVVAGAFFFLVSHTTGRSGRFPERMVPVVSLRTDKTGAWSFTLAWSVQALAPDPKRHRNERGGCRVNRAPPRRAPVAES